MDELVKLVAQKTGLSDQMARAVVDTVVNYLKGRLPTPTAGQIDAVLSGQTPGGDFTKGLGSLLGKK